MIEITYIDELSDEVLKILDEEFDKYANKKSVECDYKCFNFVAKDGEKIVGMRLNL